MTIIRFFTDPHLGRELKANTTPASRELLGRQLYEHALVATSMPEPRGLGVHGTVCAGDLFDTDHNDESVLIQGYEAARHCNLVLGGNHDVVNITGRESSLSALAKLTDPARFILPPGPGKVAWEVREFGDVRVFVVPHHARQQEFDAALEQVYQELFVEGQTEPVKGRRLLLVHCNYHLTMEAGETDINLSDAACRKLLRVFDYIVMGHDHRPRRECDDRVIILGNTHPTSFSDLGQKYVWFYDSEINDFTRQPLTSDASLALSAGDLIEIHKADGWHRIADYEWIDLAGELPPEAAVDLGRAVRAAFKEIPYLYALRASKVRFSVAMEEGVEVAPQQLTLLELVEADLGKSPELLELFREAKEARD